MSNIVEQDDKRGYLYRHVRLDTDEVFYVGIGITKNYARAYNKHHRNPFWKNVVNKTNYEVEILMDDVPYDLLQEKEKEFIKLYGRRNINQGTLTNLTDGGEGVLGCVNPHKGKGKSWSDICKNPEQVRINRENRSDPYIITVIEPCGNTFDIRCENIIDFTMKLKITSKYLVNVLKKGKDVEILRRKASTKHNFKTGTILKYTPIDRPKQVFKYPSLPRRNKYTPFTVTVVEPTRDPYDIFCESNKDFFKKVKNDSNTIGKLKRHQPVVIQHVRKDSNQSFPVGTVIRLKSLGKPIMES